MRSIGGFIELRLLSLVILSEVGVVNLAIINHLINHFVNHSVDHFINHAISHTILIIASYPLAIWARARNGRPVRFFTTRAARFRSHADLHQDGHRQDDRNGR